MENFPEVFLLAILGVRKCHGFKGQIIRKNCQPPKDLVLSMQVHQIWKLHPQSIIWYHHYDNVYFHLTISCVQKHNNKFTIQDVTMAADTFTLLTPKHLCFLHKKGLLEIIVVKHK